MTRRFFFWFAVSALWTLLVAVLAPARYETLDDVMINQLLRAGEESVFFGLFPGLVVRGLLAVFGNCIAVYPVFQLVLTALAFALILHWAFTHGRALEPFAPVVIAAITLAVQARFVIQFTFTTTAALLCSALLLVLAGRRTPLRAAPAFGLGLAFGFAYLIRGQSGLLSLLLAAPALVWILWTERRLRPTAALFVLGAFLVIEGNRQYFLRGASPAFRSYLAFNEVRGRLHMYERLYARKNFEQVLRENQWSPTDYEMFATWLPADEKVFTVQTLSVVDRLTALTPADRLRAFTPDSALRLVRQHADAFLWLALFGCAGLALHRDRPRALFLLLSALAFALLLTVMHFWMRLPRRVSDPAVVGAAVTTLLILYRGGRSAHGGTSAHRELLPAVPWSKPGLAVLGALAVLLLVFHARTLLTLRADNRENQARIDRQFDHFTRTFPGKILFLKTNGFFEPAHDNPFRDRHEPFERLSFTWMTQSPYFYATLKRLFGVERGADYFPALVDNPRVVFVCQPEFTTLLPTHLRERRNLSTHFEPVAPPFEEFHFYRLVSRP